MHTTERAENPDSSEAWGKKLNAHIGCHL